MAIKVIVFDFDGTLVDSNRLKYSAFFKLFPSDEFHVRIITDVLREFFEESRYIILKEILCRIEGGKEKTLHTEIKVEKLAKKYNDIVLTEVKRCNDKPGAKKALERLHDKHKLYLSSTTADESLKEIVKCRGWDRYFCDVFGWPKEKIFTLIEIMHRESIGPNEILVVGDGEADKVSASEVGCRFFPVNNDGLLEKLVTEAETWLK